MELRSFKLTHRFDDDDGHHIYADVCEITTTGRLWWKKRWPTMRTVYSSSGVVWVVVATGQEVPHADIYPLYKAALAREALVKHLAKAEAK